MSSKCQINDISDARGVSPDELKDLVQAALAQGWEIWITSGNHLQFRPADKTKQIVHTPITASDVRSVRNARSQLRKSGLDV